MPHAICKETLWLTEERGEDEDGEKVSLILLAETEAVSRL